MERIFTPYSRQTKCNFILPLSQKEEISLSKRNNTHEQHSKLGERINQQSVEQLPFQMITQTNCQGAFQADQNNSLTRRDFRKTQTSNNNIKFLPFFNERDSIGRLISNNSTELTDLTEHDHKKEEESKLKKQKSPLYKKLFLLNLERFENALNKTSEPFLTQGRKEIEQAQNRKDSSSPINNKFYQNIPRQKFNSLHTQLKACIPFQRYFILNQDKVKEYQTSDSLSKKYFFHGEGNLKKDNSFGDKMTSIKLSKTESSIKNQTFYEDKDSIQRQSSRKKDHNQNNPPFTQKIQKKQIFDFKSAQKYSIPPIKQNTQQTDLYEDFKNPNLKQESSVILTTKISKLQNQTQDTERVTRESQKKVPSRNMKTQAIPHGFYPDRKIKQNIRQQISVKDIRSTDQIQNSQEIQKTIQEISLPQLENQNKTSRTQYENKRPPSQQFRHKNSHEYSGTFAEFFQGIKVSQTDIDHMIQNDLAHFTIGNQKEEKLANFSSENIKSFMKSISNLKIRAKKLKKNIHQMSERAMISIRFEEAQNQIAYQSISFKK